MGSKLKIKIGAFELEYEIDEAISKSDVLEVVGKLTEILPKQALQAAPPPAGSGSGDNPQPSPAGDLSTSTIAQKLGVDSGPTLARAALARLCIFDKKSAVKRKDILAEMKAASSFYKKTYNNNLTTTLARLVTDGEFNQVSPDTYALSEVAVKAIKTALNAKG